MLQLQPSHEQMVRKSRVISLAVLLSAIILLFSSCAKIKSPPGGPTDRVGPVPVVTVPEDRQRNVSRDIRIEVLFDSRLKTIDPTLVSISPFPAAGIRVVGKNRRLLIEPLEPLQPNQTYRVTISPKLADERSNPMSEPLELLFSTGDSLDDGVLRGKVYDTTMRSGIWIWAWRIDGEAGSRYQNSEPQPWWDIPDVVTATDSVGGFRFAGLKDGKYRLFAIDDKNRDRRYDPSIDRLGITFEDAIVPRDSAVEFSFQLAQRDTIPPTILNARMVAPRIATVRFSRPVTARIGTQPLIRASDRNSYVGISYPDPTDSTKWWCVFPTVPEVDTLQLSFVNFIDWQGVKIPDTTVTPRFPTQTKGVDTLAPTIVSLNPPPGWVFKKTIWKVKTNLGVRATDFREAFSAITIPDSQVVPLFVQPIDPLTATIRMENELSERRQFELHCNPSKLRSLTDVSGRDTMLVYTYRVYPGDTTGTVETEVIDLWPGASGTVVLEAVSNRFPGSSIGWVSTSSRDIVESATTGILQIQNLPGTYRLRAFRDMNQNGVPDPGTLRPFRHAEPLIIADTVRVRSRWTVETDPIRIR
ncbi:MAG: Ig-like domain-containing protein [bacterium]|nr:Ig-like domain-containing protein [bacterium]